MTQLLHAYPGVAGGQSMAAAMGYVFDAMAGMAVYPVEDKAIPPAAGPGRVVALAQYQRPKHCLALAMDQVLADRITQRVRPDLLGAGQDESRDGLCLLLEVLATHSCPDRQQRPERAQTFDVDSLARFLHWNVTLGRWVFVYEQSPIWLLMCPGAY